MAGLIPGTLLLWGCANYWATTLPELFTQKSLGNKKQKKILFHLFNLLMLLKTDHSNRDGHKIVIEKLFNKQYSYSLL